MSPASRVALDSHSAAGPTLTAPIFKRIVEAFALGTGHGLLHLGAAELETELAPSLSYFRELGRSFVGASCAIAQHPTSTEIPLPEPDTETIARLAAAPPLMRGAELVSPEILTQLWSQLGSALRERAADFEGGVQGYLSQAHSVWHVAGRICLHLAERKNDPELPFAFIATYARQVSGRAQPQHVPLSRALQEFSGAGNKPKLLSLLTPLQQAAETSELIRRLVHSGQVYHPLAWTSEQAHQFLCQADIFEKAGLVVRLPDWWRTKRRPSVSVTVGQSAPSTVGMQALLDFDVNVTLGGQSLSESETAALLQANAGLVLIKGQWVEVNAERLSQVLDQWRSVADQASTGGVSFAEAMRLMSGADLQDTNALESDPRTQWSDVVAGDWLKAQLQALRDPAVLSGLEELAGLNATLRPYQVVGLQWLWTLRQLGLGGCLADDMGLGKTIQVIALLSILHKKDEPGTDLLVVPASLVENWRSEIERFAPHLDVLVAHTSQVPSARLRDLEPPEIEACDVVITTYGTAMRIPWMSQITWRVLALDEAQAIKNPSAKQTRAIKGLSAQWRLTLTGTPVENKLGDLWSLFDFMNPGLLGSAADFGRMCKRMSRGPNGYGPLRNLVGPYILRRLKTDKKVISDLPDKTEVTTHCLLSKPQAVLYKQSVQALATGLAGAEGIARRGVVLAFLMRFKQICNHPSQWLGDGEFNPSHSGKFDRLAALCEPIAERQEKVLVFTQFRTMTLALQQHLQACFGKPGLVLHGGTPVKKRQALVQRFQEDEDIPFMILSLKAGGTGLNLTAANHVIHFDRWWNPAVERQATDRAFRIGQRKSVLVHKFVCQGTIEERIDQLITSKEALSDEVLSGGAESQITELSNKELMQMVKLDLSSAVSS